MNRAASDDEIDAAYERLSRLYNPAVSKKPRAQARWQQISEAYETLSDPQRRAAYDRKLSRSARRAAAGNRTAAVPNEPVYASPAPQSAVVVGFIVVLVAISIFFEDGPEPAVSRAQRNDTGLVA